MTIDVTVNANTNPAIQALERLTNKIEQTQEKFSAGFDKMNAAAVGLAATLLAIGTATAKFADEITDVADANGLATAEVLALQSALAASGGKADNAGQALQRLSQAVEDANGGNMKLVGSFQRMGLSMSDLGKLSSSEIRGKLFDSLASIADPMERNALAAQFFGKSLVGVDLKKFLDEERAAREEAEKYAPALESAGQAFDNIAKIAKQIKLAFAEAFQPLFDAIGGIKINTDALVIGLRAMGAALVAITAAGVVRGVLALREAFILLNAVISKNPLIALGSVAAGIAAYVGLTKDATSATEDLAAAGEKNNKIGQQGARDQSGYNDLLKKQQSAISRSGEELARNFDLAKKKYEVDLAAFGLTEEEKKIAEAKAKIDQDAADAKRKAQEAFDALDNVSKGKQTKFLQEQLDGIEAQRQARQKASAEEIAQIEERNRLQQQLQLATDVSEKFNQTITDRIVANRKELAGSEERIRLEQRLAEIAALRAQLSQSASKLSQDDRLKAQAAANMALSDTRLLDSTYQDIGSTLADNLQMYGQSVGLSEKNIQTLINGSKTMQSVIQSTGKITTEQALQADRVQKSFAFGWDKAFVSYYESANNAAKKSEQLFNSLTKGIEDAFVNFAKTGKLSFKDMLSSIAEEILRSNIKSLLSNLFTPNTSGSGGILDSIFSGAKSLLGFANGGIIPTNGPVVVGERGPEILSGAAGRTVTPNNQLGQTVVYNINAVDAASFKSMIARDPAFIHAVAQQGAKGIRR